MSENLPRAINYQGYQIKPIPMKVLVENTERWNTQFEILEHKGGELTVFPFCDKPTFESKDDAIKWCFPAGKHIIDNEPGKLVK